MSEQDRQLERVRVNLSSLVRQFVRELWDSGRREFHVEDLTRWVQARVAAAPGSPDRILRQMRSQGEFDYEIVNRRASHYRITMLGEIHYIQKEMF